MKFFKCILILVFLVCQNSFSQQDKVLDSFYAVWEDTSKKKLDRALAYQKYIWDKYIDLKPDSALILSKKLIRFSNDNSFDKARALALSTQGQIFSNQSNFPKSIDLLKQSLAINKKLKDKSGIAGVINQLGNVYKRNGEYDSALDFYEQSRHIFKELDDKNGLADVFENLGSIYIYLGEYEKSLNFHKRSLEIEKELGNIRGEAISLNNIGINYAVQGNYEVAMEYFKQSYDIEFKTNNLKGQALSLYSIGTVYLRKNKIEKSIETCLKGSNLIKDTKLTYEKESLCYCLYEAYKAKGNNDKALKYHEQMLKYNDSLKSEETAKKLQRMEFEKQVLADSLLQVEKDLKVKMAHQAEVRKKDRNKNIAMAGGIFLLFISGGLYGRWRYVKKSKAIIEKEKDRSDNLLLNILPSEIAEELKAKGSADARDFDMVSILFTDFKGFTEVSAKLSAQELINEINTCFKAFDHICESYNIEKIKTIGDAYMAAGGLPVPSESAAKNTVLAAIEMQKFICDRYEAKVSKSETAFKMRVGIHTGPVVAGIVGIKKFQYDIWGDTVNTASRMESSGVVDKINISEVTYELLKGDSDLVFESRGKIAAKGKGEIEMYFVSKP